MITVAEARDDIFSLFRDAWEADPFTTGKPILWDDHSGEPPASGEWARVTVRHLTGDQSALANDQGKTRWSRSGIVTVQLFSPIGFGLESNDSLCKIAEAAFRGKRSPSGAIWFRKVATREVGPDGAFFQSNVTAHFFYDFID